MKDHFLLIFALVLACSSTTSVQAGEDFDSNFLLPTPGGIITSISAELIRDSKAGIINVFKE